MVKTEAFTYRDGDVELEGFAAYDAEIRGRRPGVLVSHAWGGPLEFERGRARALAELGYVGLAIDLYGVGKRGSGPEENARLMQPFLDDRSLLRRRITAGLDALRRLDSVDPDRLGAIGYCFGGLCVLDLARSGADLRGVVSFHGLLDAPRGVEAKRIRAKVLVLHGHDDPLVSAESFNAFTREMTEGAADWQIHQYGHTAHAFTNPEANDRAGGIVYSATADRRSWIAMRNFFEEIFT